MLLGRRVLATIMITACILATAACSSSGGSDDPSVLPPAMADFSTIDGTTVQVPEGGTLDITGDDETYADWTADIADEDILTFTPGKDDGSATFNPGFEAKKEGTTDVEMKNSTSGDEVHFTVEVTPAT